MAMSITGVSIEAWTARARAVLAGRGATVDRGREDNRIGDDEVVVLVGNDRERDIKDRVIDQQAIALNLDSDKSRIDVDPVADLAVLEFVKLLVAVEVHLDLAEIWRSMQNAELPGEHRLGTSRGGQ
jgi:hypothetical protein